MSRPPENEGPVRGFEHELIERSLGEASDRRAFLARMGRWTGGLLAAVAFGGLAGCSSGTRRAAGTAPGTAPAGATAPATAGGAELAVATGGDPGACARRALDAIGGMGAFVKPGQVVVIKANASFFDGPEGGTSTHPSVVSEVAVMCREAGASRVIVTDHCLRGAADECFRSNGIGAAARAAGAEVVAYGGSDGSGGRVVPVPGGVSLATASVYPVVLDADVVITVPKAKHHGGAGLSLGMKNLIGVTSNMSSIHNGDLHEGIADLASLVRPALSVVDASIVLAGNGPGGPGPTRTLDTVIASGDFVAADSYACSLFGLGPSDVPYVEAAGRRGLGKVDLGTVRVVKV